MKHKLSILTKFKLKLLIICKLKKELIGNIAKTIEMISEKVDEPFINQQHLDELEQLRTHIDEETGIKATHEEGILHPVESY